MNKKKYMHIEFLVIFLAIALAIKYQLPVLTNYYIINDDVRQHIYWMQQFHDSDLFKNGLLTEYAKRYQPWGFIFLYYLLSFIIDPITISRILPIVLFAISSLYLFKLVEYITDSYAGFLAVLVFMITPTYMDRMLGGLPRAFGYPFMILFLYYLIKKEYLKSSLILVLQSLFYPMIFFVSAITYMLTFIKIENKKISLHKFFAKRNFFIYAMCISAFILCAKYILNRNTSIGTAVTRKQMIGDPVYYKGGRYPVLPTPPLLRELAVNVDKSISFPRWPWSRKMILVKSKIVKGSLMLSIVIFLFAFGIFRRKSLLPLEIFFLFLSSVLMFIIADSLLLKLFLPSRYLKYSIPIISLIAYSIIVYLLITQLKNARVRNVLKIIVFVFVLLSYNVKQNFRFADMSRYKDLYKYLNSLPKDVMIAAPPRLADGIPAFAQRKVFINYELSHPFYGKYWEVIKERTVKFFNAYYSEDPLFIYNFCEENNIDYLVVSKSQFTKRYIMRDNIYIAPFSAYIRDIAKSRRNFVLKHIPEKNKLFIKGDTFVIKKDVLKKLIYLRNNDKW